MADSSAANFTGSVPQYYDADLGPLIFVDYAAEIAARASAFKPARVLETAAGTGLVTRCLRNALPAGTELIATDLNAPMLEVAKQKFAGNERVTFQAADATDLPFADRSFDAVVCQFGVMFYPDKDQSYRTVRRILSPGGRYLFSVWDSHSHNPYGRLAYETVAKFFPDNPPQFHKVPFGYAGIDTIKESVLAAGFTALDISVSHRLKENADPDSLARGFVLGTPVGEQIERRGSVRPQEVIAALSSVFRSELGLPQRPLALQAIIFEAA